MGQAAEVASFGYHEVTDDPTSSGFQRPAALPYKLTCQTFARHLAEIAAGARNPALIDEIDLSRPGRHLLLTFDDGGKSALRAGEALARRGWKGHFFIITSRVGGRGFLHAAEIRRLRTYGHIIGSHSHTHPSLFRELPFERMLEEWRISSDWLAQLLGEACIAASVPGGDISARVLRSAGEAGVHYLFTSEPTLTPRRVNGCWILGRFVAKTGTPPSQVRELAQLRGWGRAMLGRRLKVGARLLLPAVYRRYIRYQTVEFREEPPESRDHLRRP
jgi:peptidoglycan/xylan/chitin deacetylase (PgdA/CDA1 family)